MFTQIKKHPLILGTLLLTGAGTISRIMGFFYRIFLSRTIGASGLGLYQLIFPVFSLCLAIAASGIQTAISRYVAASSNRRNYLFVGMSISLVLAALFSFSVYLLAPFIASDILKEPRCEELLRLMVYALLPACIHACFNGYYYGMKQSTVPALCQITEQVVRIGATLIIYYVLCEEGNSLAPIHAVWGLVLSEIAGLLVCLMAYCGTDNTHKTVTDRNERSKTFAALITMAIPLSLNHILMTLSHSLEHMLLPQQLMVFGYTADEALGHFGVLSGMAMSVIFFPAVITNSLSVLLLPRISEAHAKGEHKQVWDTIKGALCCGIALGSLCTFFFLFSSNWIGIYLFEDPLAGFYIQTLSILCPFLYTANLLCSIVNGLGLTRLTLGCNLSGCGIRILAIWYYVPEYGIYAYIWAMILSQIIVMAELIYIILRKCYPITD